MKKTVEASQKVVDGSHPDARHLRHVYAIMAVLTLEWPALGTFNEAVEYYQKATACERKQIQLKKIKEWTWSERQHFFTSQAHYKCSVAYLTAAHVSDRKKKICL